MCVSECMLVSDAGVRANRGLEQLQAGQNLCECVLAHADDATIS